MWLDGHVYQSGFVLIRELFLSLFLIAYETFDKMTRCKVSSSWDYVGIVLTALQSTNDKKIILSL